MQVYASHLPESPGGLYLGSRGLRPGPGSPDQQEIDKFYLGYVENPLHGHDSYEGYLAIPYLRYSQSSKGSVVSVRFRCIQDHDCKEIKYHSKYVTEAGDRPRLYNTIALLEPSSVICITEGEIDAITAQIITGIPTVGVPGSENWKPHFREPFLGYETVYILADGDEAGRKFASTVARSLPNAKVILMPDGYDVNSLVVTSGGTALVERIG